MRYYPIFLDLHGRRTVVVGGGKVAERKVRKLLGAGARVHVISPEFTPGLARLAATGKVRVSRRRYRKGDWDVKGRTAVRLCWFLPRPTIWQPNAPSGKMPPAPRPS